MRPPNYLSLFEPIVDKVTFNTEPMFGGEILTILTSNFPILNISADALEYDVVTFVHINR
jgi:hypothetical protein